MVPAHGQERAAAPRQALGQIVNSVFGVCGVLARERVEEEESSANARLWYMHLVLGNLALAVFSNRGVAAEGRAQMSIVNSVPGVHGLVAHERVEEAPTNTSAPF